MRSRSSGEKICRPSTERFEARRMAVDRGDHQIGDLVAMIIPGSAVRQFRRDMLAEQAGDMLALRREVSSRVEGISISTIGSATSRRRASIIGPVHIGEAGRDDDAGGQMVAGLRQAGENAAIRTARHSSEKCPSRSDSVRCAARNPRGSGDRIDQVAEQQLGIEIGDDGARREWFRRSSAATPTARPFSTITSRTGASTGGYPRRGRRRLSPWPG